MVCKIFFLFALGQANARSQKFGVYFKCVSKENKRAIDTFSIVYNINFPFPGSEEKNIVVTKASIGKAHYVEVEALKIQFHLKHIFFEPGDTISYNVHPNGKISFVYDDQPLQDFEKTQSVTFYKDRVSPLDYLKSATDLTSYFSYCLQFFQNEQRFLDSLFGARKPTLKAHMQEFAEYRHLYFLFKGMAELPVTREDSLAFINAAIRSRNIDNPKTAAYNPYWRVFVGDYSEVLSGTFSLPYEPLKFERMIAAAREHFKPETYRKFLLWTLKRFSNIAIPEYELSARKIYGELAKMNFSQRERSLIDKKYKEVIQMSKQLASFGQIALKDVNGKNVLLKQIIKPNKLYLFDFWASWCVPCIEEIPALKRISEQYPNVQVISISIDKNKDAWLKASEKYAVNSKENYLVAELTQNKFLEDYNIKDIPRFMLFDSKGKCITSNGPRPSDEQFQSYLNSLLML